MADIPRFRHDSLERIPVLIRSNLDVHLDEIDMAIVAPDTDPLPVDFHQTEVDTAVTVEIDDNGEVVYLTICRLMVGPGSGNPGDPTSDILLPKGVLRDVVVQVLDSPEQPKINAGRIYFS